MQFLKDLDRSDLMIISIIYIVAGILLCFFNISIIMIGCRVIGLVLALVGAYFLYYYFVKRTNTNASPFFVGLPSLLIGLFMLISPESVISMLPIVIGIVFIISSILSMQKAFMLKDMGIPAWKVSLVGDIITLILGIALFFNPLQSLSYFLQVLGVFLIVDGIFLFWNDHMIRKNMNK